MKIQFLTILSCLFFISAKSQTKVFKEVSDEISTETKAIVQDNSLVGYVVFTRLEKTSADSFNYKISLMDENLNDIGAMNFREIGLDLEAVSFDQDVLCLAYLKSTTQGKTFKNKRQAKRSELKDDVLTQFLTLDGKIIKSNEIPVDLNADLQMQGSQWGVRSYQYSGDLKHRIQLTNISGKGFACFYGDADGCNLIGYDFKGNQLWKKIIDDKQQFVLLASKSDIYLLEKEKDKFIEGGGSLAGFNFDDGKPYPRIKLQDKDGRSLSLVSFGNDPVTGNPYIIGNIINNQRGNDITTVKDYTKGPYDGVYTMDINGHNKNDIQQTFVYWKDGSQKPTISTKGYLQDTKSFTMISDAFRDYNGNTYFVGSQLIRKPKIGAIVATVITLPTLVAPLFILSAGTVKCKLINANIMKLSSKGTLTYDNSIPCSNSKFMRGSTFSTTGMNLRNYYSLENPDSKNSYIIADDSKNIMIYNVNQQKVTRTIPHKAGNLRTTVVPAKDGHFMVIEYNKKEKYTSLSIEALN